MAIEWFGSNDKIGTASFYSGNITLNTIASVPFEFARRVQVGLDDKKNVVIKPLSKEKVQNGELNEHAIYRISITKTYARISSVSLMKKVSEALNIVLDKKPVKYETTWDEIENILTVHTSK